MPDPVVVVPERANHIVLAGTLADKPEFRSTPSGRLLACFILEHLSQDAAFSAQRIEVRMEVSALGDLATRCRSLTTGQAVCVQGRLNQKRWIRDGKIRWGAIELLAEQINLLPDDAGNSH
ncbi:single-stranded DNA-binding protein [Candidatus Magnetaquicoccus inordinatus]|uniref:single-stranded DNA-binding protein n=1 Tax=Candidatus Magnetaquicoccus inordinatus TaxID=2496818 RepID=UPI00102BAA71|nr:single-stranded DNA-binding protein [Candidatus Magnetaquicoccus inordinatus]